MSEILRKAVLFFLLLALPADLAGCGRVSTDVFPLEEGTGWKYRIRTSSGTDSLSVKVAGMEKLDKNTGVILSLKRDSSDETDRELYEKESSSITAYKRLNPLIDNVETTFTPPQTFLKLPLKVGDTWGWKGRVFGMECTSTFTVEKNETLAVENKRYNCIKVVEKSRSSDGRDLVCSRWFSPGYGKVREETRLTAKGSATELVVTELVEFQAPPAK